MKLSVIVVNHNHHDLLKLSLNSLIKASVGIENEIIVVDNASTDNSVSMLQTEFPHVRVIANINNEGIAKAANKGIQVSTGAYVLLVNADTICGKETLERAIEFMNDHRDAGGLCVRMLGPQGSFLPESKRGLNTAWATFFKLTGLAKQFVKSRLTDRGHKAWVEEFQTSEIDVLNGAFMFMRRSALHEVGLFDERFTMFGYDVDLSYRMRLVGFKNYYFPKTYIINFKSQPFKKFSWQYIRHFYGAMIIFATKYLFKLPEMKVPASIQLYGANYEVER